MEVVRDGQVEGTLALQRGGLLSLVIISLLRPSERINFGLFKYASFYMFSAMILLSIGVLA